MAKYIVDYGTTYNNKTGKWKSIKARKTFESLVSAKKEACSFSRNRRGFVDVMRNGITIGHCHKGRWGKGK